MEPVNLPRVSVHLDPRFTLEENWKVVEENIQDCQTRGVLVTPVTVFGHGLIVGWYLHGWVAPPGKFLYECQLPDEYILDYSI